MFSFIYDLLTRSEQLSGKNDKFHQNTKVKSFCGVMFLPGKNGRCPDGRE